VSVRRLASGRAHYNYFRDYDPFTGGYQQSDPIGLHGGSWSTYRYAAGNPVSKIDPLGLTALGAVLGGLAADGAVPEPSDVIPWKWLGWGAAIGGAIIWDACSEDEDEIDCQEWLDDLNAAWALLSIQSKGPFDKLAEKQLHDRSVDLFCTQCPDLCVQARRFGKVTLQ
jgi:RHS repeat-associated protein